MESKVLFIRVFDRVRVRDVVMLSIEGIKAAASKLVLSPLSTLVIKDPAIRWVGGMARAPAVELSIELSIGQFA